MYPRLKILRESLGMTQEDFGKSLGVAKSTYNNYEIGIREPKSDFWIAVATKYHVTIDYLLGFSNDPRKIHDVEKTAPLYSSEALKLAVDYDGLDKHGKKVVRLVADEEKTRMAEIDQKQNNECRILYLSKFRQAGPDSVPQLSVLSNAPPVRGRTYPFHHHNT